MLYLKTIPEKYCTENLKNIMSDKVNKTFCFTFAGGTADFYNKSDVLEDYGVCSIQVMTEGIMNHFTGILMNLLKI